MTVSKHACCVCEKHNLKSQRTKMFKREFKIKSNTQLKRTELRNIKEAVLKYFPNLTEADLNEIFPRKDQINIVKILSYSGELVQVYTVQNKPIIIDVKGVLLPSVFLLWRYPSLVLTFTTHAAVLTHLYNGADLMIPGVELGSGGFGVYGSFLKNSPACVNESRNKAAVAVGLTAVSSRDLLDGQKTGKCIQICHFYGDKLCTMDNARIVPLPVLGTPDSLVTNTYESDFPKLGEVRDVLPQIEEPVICSDAQEVENNVEEPQVTSETEKMDELLLYCLLTVLKYSKSLTLPILTSNFYKLQMIPVCPPDKSLDVKRSSFKKMGNFISEMCKIGLIKVKEIKKGVDTIVDFDKQHPRFIEFYLKSNERPAQDATTEEKVNSKNISEGYIITASVAPIFREFGLQKGDVVQTPDVRKYVTEFVKKHNYQEPTNKGLVNIQGDLTSIFKTTCVVSWEELMKKVYNSMKSCYAVSGNGLQEINKGKIEPITMAISTRSGNKKVTLVDNLELFGIPIHEFAKQCQHGVAASTTVSQLPGRKSQQLLVQGNQINFVYNLLKEEYKIPVKYMRGLEFAAKKIK